MNSICRLTTPTHEFSIPLDIHMIRRCRITYSQTNEIVITKDSEQNGDMEFVPSKDHENETNIIIKLTQEETKQFKAGADVEIQSRVITEGGDAIASDIFVVGVRRVLDEEVLS